MRISTALQFGCAVRRSTQQWAAQQPSALQQQVPPSSLRERQFAPDTLLAVLQLLETGTFLKGGMRCDTLIGGERLLLRAARENEASSRRHPATLALLNTSAALYYAAGDEEKAERELRKALTMRSEDDASTYDMQLVSGGGLRENEHDSPDVIRWNLEVLLHNRAVRLARLGPGAVAAALDDALVAQRGDASETATARLVDCLGALRMLYDMETLPQLPFGVPDADALVSALATRPMDADLQAAGLWALAALLLARGQEPSSAVLDIINVGAVAAAAAAMRNHPECERVQLEGCRMINQAASAAASARDMQIAAQIARAASACATPLAAALGRHSKSAAVALEATAALQKIAQSSDRGMVSVLAAGGLEAAVGALRRRQPGATDALERACEALLKGAERGVLGPAAQRTASRGGAYDGPRRPAASHAEAAIAAMRALPRNAALQTSGCVMLAAACREDRPGAMSQRTLAAAAEAVERALRDHPGCLPLRLEAAAAMRLLKETGSRTAKCCVVIADGTEGDVEQ